MSTKPQRKTATPTTDWCRIADGIAAEIAGRAAAHDAEDSFVSEGYALLQAEGLFKALVPVEFGGGGASIGDIAAVIRRLGASCGSTALAFAMHSHLVAVAAWRWQHQGAPTEGLLKRVVAEDLVLVSSGGSDWLESGGTATRTAGGFVVNARKPFSSGCPAGSLLATSTVFEDPDAGPTVLHFAVPLTAEGVKIEETWQALGMRGTGSHDIVLTDVFVPDAAISGRRPQGPWHPLFHAISMMAFALIYAAYVGVAEGARQRALTAAKGRSGNAHLPYLVGEMENAFTMAELAHAHMVHLAETAQPGPTTTSRAMTARTLTGDAAIATVEKAMEVVGGAAFSRRFGLERAWRDVQAARFHPLQKQPQLHYTGLVALSQDMV